MVVAPEFENIEEQSKQAVPVLRVPAIQKFNGSDFSMALPLSLLHSDDIREFAPDVIHSHHPFLIGSTALRTSALLRVPHVFTHHTMYEKYTHYVPGGSHRLSSFVKRLGTQYANLCDHVFAPSASVKNLLQSRGVATPIDVIPTGLNVMRHKRLGGSDFRRRLGIPKDAFVVGHVGRLAPEKNLPFLARSIARSLKGKANVYCLMVGAGTAEPAIWDEFVRLGVEGRLIMGGVLGSQALLAAYSAMDLFAFASTSETQGMVITEAMASSLPVVAIDAPGVSEVVVDKQNGFLLNAPDATMFSATINGYMELTEAEKSVFQRSAQNTASYFDSQAIACRALSIYQSLIDSDVKSKCDNHHLWEGILPLIQAEWDIVKSYADCASGAILKRPSSAELELRAG